MSLITDSYRELNSKLHDSSPAYGTSGKNYHTVIAELVKEHGPDVLDYGCGKRTLQQALNLPIHNYDPALPEFSAPPEPADIVACTDVLEHIEPDCLEEVLADIRRCTKKVAFMTIATGPARKFLADGRNAHLIQADDTWWLPKLWNAGFELIQMSKFGNELLLFLR